MEKQKAAVDSKRHRGGEAQRAKRVWPSVLAGIFASVGVAASARAFNCAQIDVSGAKSTTASGINSRGDIVGQFRDGNNLIHAFLINYRSGLTSVIDVPGSTRTQANGINPQGDIVGRFDDTAGAHGYLLSKGQFTTVQYPGSTFTQALGINAHGEIAGRYMVGAVGHGFTLIDGVYASVDAPAANGTNVLGFNGTNVFAIDDSSDVSGFYVTLNAVTHGFILNGSGFVTVDWPGALLTGVRGIAQGGHLAMGNFSTDTKLTLFHGFLYDNSLLTRFDFPGAATTEVFGVNPRGDFVGQFNTDGGSLFHGYVCRPAADGVLPVAAFAAGASGSSFRTAVALHNPYASTISGTLIYRRQAVPGSSADPTFNYTLLPYQTLDYPDFLSTTGQTGLGSLDLVATTAQVPVATARVYNDRDFSAVSAREDLIGPEDALTPGVGGILLAPDDLQRFRFNIGVRTLTAGVSMTVTVRDRGGVLRKSFSVAYPGDFFFQLSADAFLGLSLQPGDSIRITMNSGRAVVYGATADNTTQQPAIFVAARITE